MTNRKGLKADNRDNKRNDVNRPSGDKKNTKNPPKFENFNGDPIY
jgi:hypothetical protein